MSTSSRPSRRRTVPSGAEEEINVSVGNDAPKQETPPVSHDEELPAQQETTKTKQKDTSTGIRQEIMKSGLTAGNPENLKSGNQETEQKVAVAVGTSDYLGAVYGGVTDPDEDFTKVSTQLPVYVWKSLKAAAPMHQMSVQELVRDIVLGRVEALPIIAPDIVQRFHTMAEQGKLKR